MPVYDGIWTMPALLAARAAARPDFPVIRTDAADITYGELDHTANRVANAFAALGLGQGDKAAVMLPNCPEFMFIWMGLAKAGIVEVPLNTGLRGDLLAYMLNQAEVRALVIAEEWADRIDRIRGDLAMLERVIVVGGSGADDRGLAFDHLLGEADDTAPDVEITPADPAVILFTSGTTGPSKGVVLLAQRQLPRGRQRQRPHGLRPG